MRGCANVLRMENIKMRRLRNSRRHFLQSALGTGAISLLTDEFARAAPIGVDVLDAAASKSIFDRTAYKDAVIIDSIRLVRKGQEHFLHIRSKDGAEGISVDNG